MATNQETIAAAFDRSRHSLRVVVKGLQELDLALTQADNANGSDKADAIAALSRRYARDIAVISLRLRVGSDPLANDFRDALKKATILVQRNLYSSSAIIDQDELGRRAPSNYSPPGVPFAATTASDPDPRVSVCKPFFAQGEDLQRDIITHEFFHLVGLLDISVANTAQALNNAHSMAQLVSFLCDRFRQQNAGATESPANPPLPSP